jgi:site-specific DNA-methyltransferase (cytosine-N4-specific)
MLPTLDPGSVDICVTSPPYWMLRSYLSKDHPLKDRELGQEKTLEAYLENMVRVFRLVRNALADHGTVWLNIGCCEGIARPSRFTLPGRLAPGLQTKSPLGGLEKSVHAERP